MADSLSSGTAGVTITSSDTVDGKLYGMFTLPDDNKGNELYFFDPVADSYSLVSELVSGPGDGAPENSIFICNGDFTLTPDQNSFIESSGTVGTTLNYSVTFTLDNIIDTLEVINMDKEVAVDPGSSCLNNYPYAGGTCTLNFSVTPSMAGSNQTFSLDIVPSYSDNTETISVSISTVNP